MKKVLLFSFLILFALTTSVFAYETAIIRFPDGERWDPAFYKKNGNEAILQYVPLGQTNDNWVRSIVLHSYNHNEYPVDQFVSTNLARMQKANPTAKYKTLKLSKNDAMFTRCTDDYQKVQGQCEFYRATQAHGGIITIHYMNKNKADFKDNYTLWFEIVKQIKFLNSYYRGERTFNKSDFFEL